MEWMALPDPLGAVLGTFAQAAPSGGSDTLVASLISAIGGAGLSTAILWKIHAEDRNENRELKAEAKTLTQQLIDSQQVALPALQTSSQVIADALPIVRDALRLRDQRRGE